MEAPAGGGVLSRAAAALLLLLLPALPALAGQTRTVEVMAELHGVGRTPEQARREVLQRARDKAVAEVTGIDVAAQQLRLKTVTGETVDDAFSYLVRTSTQGRIVSERAEFAARVGDDGVPVYGVRLVAEVELEEGRPDPSFTLDLEASPASHAFREGEPIAATVTASRDCYLLLLNVRDDGTVVVLFPNRYATDNRLVAGTSETFPATSAPWEIHASLDGRGEGGAERILAVATLDPVPFRVPEVDDDELAAEGDPGLAALNRWLLQIQTDRRVEAVWDYRVVR